MNGHKYRKTEGGNGGFRKYTEQNKQMWTEMDSRVWNVVRDQCGRCQNVFIVVLETQLYWTCHANRRYTGDRCNLSVPQLTLRK